MQKRRVLGLVERVKLFGDDDSKTILARVDTGAERSSIDHSLAESLKITHDGKMKKIRTVHGRYERPLVSINLQIYDKTFRGRFTVSERSGMKYKVLIGQDILKQGDFIIDPQKCAK
jgi:hypothetical protein